MCYSPFIIIQHPVFRSARVNVCAASLAMALLLSGDTNPRKYMLWEELKWAHMRELPVSIAAYDRVREFDVVYQQENTYDMDTYYPNIYIVGMFEPAKGQFKRVHLLARVNPFKEYKLVKALSDLYQTDTTYLDVLVRNEKNRLETIVYRKTKKEKREEPNMEYVMWKKERVLIKDGNLTTRLIDKWNKHMFE